MGEWQCCRVGSFETFTCTRRRTCRLCMYIYIHMYIYIYICVCIHTHPVRVSILFCLEPSIQMHHHTPLVSYHVLLLLLSRNRLPCQFWRVESGRILKQLFPSQTTEIMPSHFYIISTICKHGFKTAPPCATTASFRPFWIFFSLMLSSTKIALNKWPRRCLFLAYGCLLRREAYSPNSFHREIPANRLNCRHWTQVIPKAL